MTNAVSDGKVAANRANAQSSTGPKTEAGKRRSSLNAFRHGLTGQIHIATPEGMDAFRKHCETWREALAPVGVLEIEAVQDIAEDGWRLKRPRQKKLLPVGRIQTQLNRCQTSNVQELRAASAPPRLCVEEPLP